MARFAATTDISPTTIGLGGPVVADAIQKTIEMLNWAFINRPTVHLSWCSSGGDIGSPALCPIFFAASLDVEVERLRTRIFVNADVQELLIGIRVNMATSTLGNIVVAVGATSFTFTGLTDAIVDEQTTTLETVDTGTGWLDVIVSTVSSFGSTLECQLTSVRVQDQRIILDPCNVTDLGVIVTDDGEVVTDCPDGED